MTILKRGFLKVACAAMALGCGVLAQAQGGGGFRGGGTGGFRGSGDGGGGGNRGPGGGDAPIPGGFQGNGFNNGGWVWNSGMSWTPQWASDLKTALGHEKPILVYVYPPGETETPGFFRTMEIARASRETAAFVRMPLKESDPFLRDANVRTAPVLLALDANGNEWRRAGNLTQSVVMTTLRTAAEDMTRYVDMLDKSLDQARAREDKGDERGAVFVYRKLAAEKKKGYKQIDLAREKFRQLLDKRLRDAIALLDTNDKDALQELANLAREFDGTSVGARAKLAQLRYAVEQGSDLRMRIPEIQKLAELDGEDLASVTAEAKALLEQIEGYGEALIQHAQRKSRRGDVEAARTVLRRITTDLPGTRVAKQANDELAKF